MAMKTQALLLPDPETCRRARLGRDPHFDGRFFTAVLSTGIYCRPVCPARAPREENVRYYPSAASAEVAGYRPCLRCRPELAPAESGNHEDPRIAFILKWIHSGEYVSHGIDELASLLKISDRQLRRLCIGHLGATPHQLVSTQRLLFAKQLLSDTRLPISEVALVAGFNSQRRFNTAFLKAYGMPPSRLRKAVDEPPMQTGCLVLKLGYRPPYDFTSMLGFLRTRALAGVECVGEHDYARLIGHGTSGAWLRVSQWPKQHALRVEFYLDEGDSALARLLSWVARVRQTFDLDADPRIINEAMNQVPWLAMVVAEYPGMRIPRAWDGFEAAIRAVIGQQVSVKAATTVTSRVVERLGKPCEIASFPSLARQFPSAEAIRDGNLEGLGLTSSRVRTLKAVATAFLEGEVDFDLGQTLEQFVSRWQGLPGIGPWTAHYIALRGWGHPDVLLAQDLIVRRSMQRLSGQDDPVLLDQQLQCVSPWRSYVVMHLWREASVFPKRDET